MVRRAEGPVQQHRTRAVRQPRDRPDLRRLKRLLPRHIRQDGRQPSRKHRLARAGRADEQDVVPARSGDLQRALDVFLPHDICKVGARFIRLLRLPLWLRRERPFSLQVLYQRLHVRNAVNAQPVGKRRLRGVGRGDIERFDARARRGHRHGQHAVHRAQRAGERKLAKKGRVLCGGLNLPGACKDAQQDRQIVERALFPESRRGKVHRDAGDGELHAAVLHCRTHALARFLHRRIAEADNVERGKPAGQKAFHRHLVARDALKPQRAHRCDHRFVLLFCTHEGAHFCLFALV